MEEPRPQSTMEAASVLWNISRAFLARLLFVGHSVITVWQTAQVTGADWLWGFALLILLVVFEGSHTIIMRAGDERKWFCTSVLLYVLATAPPIWLLETHLCDYRSQGTVRSMNLDVTPEEEELRLQMIEQVMLVILIVGRWLLPKGEISSELLSQILLAYLAIASDIVEFFDVFKEPVVYRSRTIQHVVLFAWTLSLLQFPFVITVSRARKMRVAITKIDDFPERKAGGGVWKMTHDVDLWAILLANILQDIPFLLIRLYLMFVHRLANYTMIFFTCKNALIIVLQTYRAFVLISDRYFQKKESKTTETTPRKKRRGIRGNSRGGMNEDEEMMLSEPLTTTNHHRRRSRDKGRGSSHPPGKRVSLIHTERSPAARSGSVDAREIVGSGGSSGGDHNRNVQPRSKTKGKRRGREHRERSRERERERERERDRERI